MRITIIPSDKLVIIDGEAIKFDFTVDNNIHAVQWDGRSGVIETKTGKDVYITNMDMFQDVIDEYARQLTIISEERMQAEKEAKLPINIWKNQMIESDAILQRDLEDNYDTLIKMDLIALSDLPQITQDKYNKKKELRNSKPV